MDSLRGMRRLRRRVRIGAPDLSLTPVSGMAAVTELVDRLGMIKLLDAAIGPIKARRRGFSGGQLLVGLASAQLAGEDFLVGLDRRRADVAGQVLAPVAALSSTTAAGLARKFTEGQWRAAETGIGDIHTAMLAALPPGRAAALCDAVTIDLDTTDVEDYGPKKRGVAFNYQGPRCGRPHVATWAQTATALAADLMAGNEDPRSHAPDLLTRALGALPAAARRGRIRLRADAGYFAGALARAAHCAGVEFAIGAKRIAPLWRILNGFTEQAWTEAIDMDGAQVAVASYCPDWWPTATRLLIRRVRLDIDARGGLPRPPGTTPPHPAPRPAGTAPRSAGRPRRGVRVLVHRDQPGCVHTGQSHRGRALVPPPHPDREHLPRQQTRRRAASPPLRVSAGQHRVDVGRAARGQHRRLAAPAHRHPRTPRATARSRRPRRPSHDRHPAPQTDPRTRPPGPPRRCPRPTPTTGTPPARKGPRPPPRTPRNVLTRPNRPRTPRNPLTRGDARAVGLPSIQQTPPRRSTNLE